MTETTPVGHDWHEAVLRILVDDRDAGRISALAAFELATEARRLCKTCRLTDEPGETGEPQATASPAPQTPPGRHPEGAAGAAS